MHWFTPGGCLSGPGACGSVRPLRVVGCPWPLGLELGPLWHTRLPLELMCTTLQPPLASAPRLLGDPSSGALLSSFRESGTVAPPLVFLGLLLEVIHVTGYVGREVNVSCSYDEGYESYEKYLCKNDCGNYDALITSDTKSNGRFTLDDDKVSGTFTVTINNLTQNDSGSYLCGVHRNSELDIFTYVELEVQGNKTPFPASP
uniref:Immunoglobulin domain-containing protein n=1 Tax=Pundamilia nyererei TaxID=303518 RepID=A0A3B4H4Q9_9CICH